MSRVFFFFEPKVLWYKYGQMKMTTNTVTKVNYKRCHYSKIVFNTQYIPSSGMFIPNSFTHCPILTELKLDGLSRLGNSVVTSSFFFFLWFNSNFHCFRSSAPQN